MRHRLWMKHFGLLLCLVFTPCAVASAQIDWVDESTCKGCHPAQYEDWLGSHHQQAMQPATEAVVLGDFSNHTFSSSIGPVRFYRRAAEFRVDVAGPNAHAQGYRVAYTFGLEPLQQYLLALPDGRYQALGVAWDTEQKRWFELPSDAQGETGSLLPAPDLNANFMCMECHNTGFRRNYDPEKDTYASTWHATGVGCQSCHGPAAEHLQWAGAANRQSLVDPLAGRLTQAGQVDACGRCHSRRAALGDGYSHLHTLMDDYLPNALTPILNEIDGKIREEVFEHGSFVQSRMYAAGVVCSDCHQPHSGELRQGGNALCVQCHNPQAQPVRAGIETRGLQAKDYDSPKHHRHQPGTPAAQCISCHMPGRFYMGNDWRHDHGFTSPNPQQARELGHSDACLGCHHDLSMEQLSGRFGGFSVRDGGYAHALSRIRGGQAGAAQALWGQLKRKDLAPIRRATLLAELPRYPARQSSELAGRALRDPAAQVREMAIRVFSELAGPEAVRQGLLPLLGDEVRAVRISAAWHLLPHLLPDEHSRADFRSALAEYESAQMALRERPEANLNLAMLYSLSGRDARVEPALRDALERNASFTPATITLAQWLEQRGQLRMADQLLRDALRKQPGADLHHALGLSLVRRGDRAEAMEQLKLAAQMSPDNSDYLYAYALSLYEAGRKTEALDMLQERLRKDPAHRPIHRALRAFAKRTGDRVMAESLARLLGSINPEDPLLHGNGP